MVFLDKNHVKPFKNLLNNISNLKNYHKLYFLDGIKLYSALCSPEKKYHEFYWDKKNVIDKKLLTYRFRIILVKDYFPNPFTNPFFFSFSL